MTNAQIGILCFVACIGICVMLIPAVMKIEGREEWYHRGWQDCLKAYRHFEMSADDEIVLKNLKSALRAYLDAKGYREKGDIKKIAQINDFEKLRHVTWETCTRKKGKKK